MIVPQLRDHSKEWCSNGKPWSPVKAEDFPLYMGSDCLAYNIGLFLTIFPASIEDAIFIQYSRNHWRHDRYPILKESEMRSISNSRGIAWDMIVIQYSTNRRRNPYSTYGESINSRGIVGVVINFWYLTGLREVQCWSRDWRRDQLLILNSAARGTSGRRRGRSCRDDWIAYDCWRRDHYPVLNKVHWIIFQMEALIEDTIDTHGIGDAVNVRYSTMLLRTEALLGCTWYSRKWRNLFNAQVLWRFPFKQ